MLIVFSFSMADVVVGYTVMFVSAINNGSLLDGLTSVQAYLERLKARPAFLSSMGTLADWTQPLVH